MNFAEQKEQRRKARDCRRQRRATPRKREVGGVLIETDKPGIKAEREEVSITTDAEADARMLAAAIAPQHAALVAHFARHELPPDEVARLTSDEYREREAEAARNCPPDTLTWNAISALAEAGGLQDALVAWLRVQQYAYDELESGVRSANATGNTLPLERARFLALRDKFIDQWQPDGGIDLALIDMLAQSFDLYLYWTQISHARAVGLCTNLEDVQRREGHGKWRLPYETVSDAIDQAQQMADRYNRIFLRTLRQLRDLRRYAPPVIVNNGGQVNVANQQVNVNGGNRS